MNFAQFLATALALGFKRGGGGSGGNASLGSATPKTLGTASAGTDATFASRQDHVHQMVNALQVGAIGQPSASWNASTNTPALASNSPPSTAPFAYTVSVAGTTTLDGISSWAVGDVLYTDGTHWQQIAASNVGITTSLLLKGNGAGGAAAAAPGIDYLPGPLLACNVPIAPFLPDGSVGANGALTLGTSMATQAGGVYTHLWGYFPANVINGSNAADFYYIVMSSGTAGQVFNNLYTPGTNAIGTGSWHVPASPTAFSGTAGSSFSAGTASITSHSFVIPANSLGPNGNILTDCFSRNNSTAGTKTVQQMVSAQNLGYNNAQTTNSQNHGGAYIWNMGLTNYQQSFGIGPSNSGAVGNIRNFDSTAALTCTLTATRTVTTDWLVIETLNVMMTPGV